MKYSNVEYDPIAAAKEHNGVSCEGNVALKPFFEPLISRKDGKYYKKFRLL